MYLNIHVEHSALCHCRALTGELPFDLNHGGSGAYPEKTACMLGILPGWDGSFQGMETTLTPRGNLVYQIHPLKDFFFSVAHAQHSSTKDWDVPFR